MRKILTIWEKNLENSDQKNVSSKKMTHFSIMVALILAGNPVVERIFANDINNARVIFLPEKNLENSGIMSITIEGKAGICNYSIVNVKNIPHFATARHCVEETDFFSWPDIIISENLKKTTEILNGKKSEWAKEDTNHKPKITTMAPIDSSVVYQKNLAMKGCFPDSVNGNLCIEIRGDGKISRGIIQMNISREDAKKIFSHNTRAGRYGLQGLSGSPLYDGDGNFVGVFSASQFYVNTEKHNAIDNFLYSQSENFPLYFVPAKE